MTQEDNIYGNFLQLMQEIGEEQISAPFFIGTVTQAEPLVITLGEISIERRNLKVNPALLAGYRRRLRLDTTKATGETAQRSGGSGDAAFSSHSHGQNTIGVPDGTFTTLDTLKVGDEVVMLMSADGQQYIVLCKVV